MSNIKYVPYKVKDISLAEWEEKKLISRSRDARTYGFKRKLVIQNHSKGLELLVVYI